MFRKLKRTWSHNDLNYIPKFRETFPELNKLSSEDLCDRFSELGVDFYVEHKTPVKLWVRFTVPFAVITILLMVLFSPIKFLFTGKWGYSYGDKAFLLNWFRALKWY